MAERRSIGAAMEMTPEKLAFIKGETNQTLPSQPSSSRKAEEEIADLIASANGSETVKDPAIRPQRKNRRSSHEMPRASEVLDQVLVPVTIRLPRRTAQALRRAYLEQRLKSAKPDTQQEIAEEALVEWLGRFGYLDY